MSPTGAVGFGSSVMICRLWRLGLEMAFCCQLTTGRQLAAGKATAIAFATTCCGQGPVLRGHSVCRDIGDWTRLRWLACRCTGRRA